MAENSSIEWTTHTFNPWIGCTRVSPGCANCYAAAQDKFRSWTPEGWGKGKPRRRTSAANWKQVEKWNREAESFPWSPIEGPYSKANRPRVFCASLADWLDDEVPIEWLADLLDLIRRTPNLDWLLLTKRPQNFQTRLVAVQQHAAHRDDLARLGVFVSLWVLGTPPANVWIGTTVEDQARADERIPLLLSIPAKMRFLSCEPLLGPVDLINIGPAIRGEKLSALEEIIGTPAMERPRIDWVICGGESGPSARPMQAAWARSLRDQCQVAGVPFLFKQWGEFRPSSDDPADRFMDCVGKKAAGRLLDGREWNEFPAAILSQPAAA